MRNFMIAAAAVAAVGLTSAAPANATYWACKGGHVACGSSAKAKPSRNYQPQRAVRAKVCRKSETTRSASRKTVKKRVRTSKVTRTSRKRHSGHSGGGSYSGLASYYWQPQRVASGGWFNPNALTAAHKTLPFGTRVRVTNRHNGRSVVVKINDRGPYVRGRVIDLSSRAAGVIGMKGSGVVPVSIAVVGR